MVCALWKLKERCDETEELLLNEMLEKNSTSPCIQKPQVTAPKQLPQNISPQNHPYSLHKRCRSSSSIRRHIKNMAPLTSALTQ